MKYVYIVRHCSATGQSPEAPLTDKGKEQAQRLSAVLRNKNVEAIVSSPYVRALQSIQPLGQALNVTVQTDPRLSERILSLEPIDNWLECLEKTFIDFDLAYEGGETSRQAMNRAMELVEEVLNSSQKHVVIVTHGNLMTLLLRHFDNRFGFEEWALLTNPDVYQVIFDGQQSTVERIWEGEL